MKKTPRYIFLSRGKVAIVDFEDYDMLAQYKWYAQVRYGNLWHAARHDGPTKTCYMHRQILGSPAGRLVDHINGDGLDNQRRNLRLADKQTNARNAKIRSDNTSGYKGVSVAHKKCKERPWLATFQIEKGRQKFLGYFESKEEAARAYDRAAKEHFGQYAKLNFPESA